MRLKRFDDRTPPRRPCPRCGYDLRGLPGDDVICPECGTQTHVSSFPTENARRLRELHGAGDALVLASVALLAAAGLALLGFKGGLAVGVAILGALLALYALGTCRRMAQGDQEWPPGLPQYVLNTVLLAALPFGSWALATIVAWRLRNNDPASSIEFVDAAVSLPPTVVILVFSRVLRRVRWKQRRAFVRVARWVTGKPLRNEQVSD